MAAAYDPRNDFYTLLGVAERATADEIKAAYRNKMRVVHPDRNGGSALATRQAQSINVAYRTLANPLTRAQYDMLRRAHRYTTVRPTSRGKVPSQAVARAGQRNTEKNAEEPGWGTILGSIAVAGLTAGGMALLQRFLRKRRA